MDEKSLRIRDYTLGASEKKVFNGFSGFMLIYVREGSGTFCLNSDFFDYVPGTIVIMSCLDYFKKESSCSQTKLTVLEFPETTFSGRILEFFSIRSLPICTSFAHDRKKPEALLDMIADSMDKTLKNNDIFLRNLSKELLIYTVRNWSYGNEIRLLDVKTEYAVLYIYSHFRESLTLEEVAAYVRYSANYFYHSFQKNTGTTFQKFLHNLRLEYALNLIRFSDLSVSDICYECGYNSVQYFSTSFRKKFGKSPKNFINDIKI